MSMTDFLAWEKTSRDIIDFKKIYVDMADCDLVAGLALSEIVYWHLPNKEGNSKLRVEHDGKFWIAVRRYEWWDRARITPDQSDRALKILVNEGLIEKKIFKFNGDPTIHIRIIEDRFLSLWNELAGMDRQNPFTPQQNSISVETEKGIALQAIPLTEVTAKGTPEINNQVVVVLEPEQPPAPPPAPVEEPLPPRPNSYTIYEQEIGGLTPMISDMLNEFDKDYPQDWFVDAVKEAKASATRGVSLNYVEAILKRWKSEGRTVNNARKAPEPVYAERW
jgi:DnaD/phage-associated family protein